MVKFTFFIKKKLFLNYSLLKKKIRKNNKFSHLKKFNIRKFYSFVTQFKKSLVNFYGPMKVKFLKLLIYRLKFKSISFQVKNFTQNKILSFPFRNDRTLSFINSLEGMLCIILYRLNIVTSIFESFYVITNGFILVNDKIIKNPKYFINSFDIIFFKNKNLVNLNKKRVKNYEILKSSHLLINYGNGICLKT